MDIMRVSIALANTLAMPPASLSFTESEDSDSSLFLNKVRAACRSPTPKGRPDPVSEVEVGRGALLDLGTSPDLAALGGTGLGGGGMRGGGGGGAGAPPIGGGGGGGAEAPPIGGGTGTLIAGGGGGGGGAPLIEGAGGLIAGSGGGGGAPLFEGTPIAGGGADMPRLFSPFDNSFSGSGGGVATGLEVGPCLGKISSYSLPSLLNLLPVLARPLIGGPPSEKEEEEGI